MISNTHPQHWKWKATRCEKEGCIRTRMKMWTHCGHHHSEGQTLKGYKRKARGK